MASCQAVPLFGFVSIFLRIIIKPINQEISLLNFFKKNTETKVSGSIISVVGKILLRSYGAFEYTKSPI